MPAKDFLDLLVVSWILLALITFTVLLFKTTPPYGRYFRKDWGPTIDNRTGWILMEIVSPAAFLLVLTGTRWIDMKAELKIAVSLYLIHYLYRSVIFPFRIRTDGKSMPFVIFIMAVLFNLINGSLNSYYLVHFHSGNEPDPNHFFLTGLILFVSGFILHTLSDHHLIQLRKPGETHYKIPTGFTFRYVSCPNYLGEIIQWIGFALVAWNIAAVSFAVWTMANLIPRAISHHKWYKKVFGPLYPSRRKALIPFVL